MLRRKIPKLKLGSKSKGGPNFDNYSVSFSLSNTSRIILQSIPVLSIFALLGINIYAITLCGSFTNQEAYAAEVIGDSTASITIGGSTSDETISAGRGSTVYRTHTISIAGNNVKNYALSIYGDSKLSYVENSSTGQLSTTEYLSSANNTKGSNLPTNTWGYAYSTSTSTSNADLTYTAPTTSAITLASGTVPTSSNGVLSITNNKLVFAAKFDEDKPSGNYKANVNLALTITPRVLTTYSITYNGNGNTSGTAPTKQEASLYDTASHSFIAPAQGTLAKTGYTFLGWAESSTATTATYTAGATIPLTAANPSKTLYAVWQRQLTWDELSTMQQMNPGACAEASVGSTKTLTDTRNGSSYTVGKLKDGNCWMMQNLHIINKTITTADSDVSSDFFIPASSSAGFTNANYNNHSAYDGGSYGGYYSWYTATAGTGTTATGKNDAASSICPKGWRLPKGNTNGDFQALYAKYPNNTTVSGFQYNGGSGFWLGATSVTNGGSFFLATGNFHDGRLDNSGSYGFYWSRTGRDSGSAFAFVFLSTYINPAYYYDLYHGFPIRCIAYSS